MPVPFMGTSSIPRFTLNPVPTKAAQKAADNGPYTQVDNPDEAPDFSLSQPQPLLSTRETSRWKTYFYITVPIIQIKSIF